MSAPLRVVVFANNRAGARAVAYLRSRSDVELVGLVLHPVERRKHGEAILAAARLPDDRILDGSTLETPATLARLATLEPALGLSVYFGYILRAPVLSLPPGGCLNLHPALLPWNRGSYPNVWPILDGTPAGATLHFMDVGIDTGDVVHQLEISVAATDTSGTLYTRLEEACQRVLEEAWPRIVAGTAERRLQDPRAGTTHRARETAALDEIDLSRTYTGRQLIDLLRARSFPPHPGAYFVSDGKKVYVRVELVEET